MMFLMTFAEGDLNVSDADIFVMTALVAVVAFAAGIFIVYGIFTLLDDLDLLNTVGAVIGFVVGFIGAVVGATFAGIGTYNYMEKSRVEYEEWYNNPIAEVIDYDNILSLERVNEVSGSIGTSFVLGIGMTHGTIKTETHYYFYVEIAPDTYRLQKVTGYDILESDGDHYYACTKKEAGTNMYTRLLVVPRGTIVREYKG